MQMRQEQQKQQYLMGSQYGNMGYIPQGNNCFYHDNSFNLFLYSIKIPFQNNIPNVLLLVDVIISSSLMLF